MNLLRNHRFQTRQRLADFRGGVTHCRGDRKDCGIKKKSNFARAGTPLHRLRLPILWIETLLQIRVFNVYSRDQEK